MRPELNWVKASIIILAMMVFRVIPIHADGVSIPGLMSIGGKTSVQFPPTAGGGASPSYVFVTSSVTSTLSGSNLIATFSVSCPAGVHSIILGTSFAQNTPDVTNVAFNGTPLTFIQSDQGPTLVGSSVLMYGGGPITCTGTDTIVVTSSASLEFLDTLLMLYAGSNFTTVGAPLASNGTVSSTISVPAAANNFGFVFTANGGATGTFTGPTGVNNHASATAPNGGTMTAADVVVTSGIISGGDITFTNANDSFLAASVWD